MAEFQSTLNGTEGAAVSVDKRCEITQGRDDMHVDKHLQLAKQLCFDMETIETSMMKMLQPHFRICKTITTAYDLNGDSVHVLGLSRVLCVCFFDRNARVQWTESTFSKVESEDISVFVQTAAKLETGDTTFHRYSVLLISWLHRITF